MTERLSDQELAALTTQLNRCAASAGPFISPMTILRLIDEVGERRALEAHAGPVSDMLAEIERLKTALQTIERHTRKIKRATDSAL